MRTNQGDRAEMFGLLCSDGTHREYFTEFLQYDKRRGKSYPSRQFKKIIEFGNIDLVLLNRFRELLRKIYGYYPNIIKSNHNVMRVSISKNEVIDDITNYVKIGKAEWFVPSFVMNGSRKVKARFIQGYFDGDGSTDITSDNIPRVRFSSTNLEGISQVKTLTDYLEIEASLNGPYKRKGKRDSYELLLKTRSIETFIKYIQSHHSKKKKRLEKIRRAMPR